MNCENCKQALDVQQLFLSRFAIEQHQGDKFLHPLLRKKHSRRTINFALYAMHAKLCKRNKQFDPHPLTTLYNSVSRSGPSILNRRTNKEENWSPHWIEKPIGQWRKYAQNIYQFNKHIYRCFCDILFTRRQFTFEPIYPSPQRAAVTHDG